MPIYSYTSDDGVTIERFYHSPHDHPQEIVEDGVTYRRDIAADFSGGYTIGGELESMSMGYPLHQVPEMVEYFARQGVDAKFNPNTGARIFANRRERGKAMKRNTLNGKPMVDFESYD